MLGRTPAEAVNHYIESAQRIVSCVSDDVVGVGGGYYISDIPHTLSPNTRRPMRIVGESGSSCIFASTTASLNPTFIMRRGQLWRKATNTASWTPTTGKSWHIIGILEEKAPSPFITSNIGHGAMLGRDELHTAHLPTGYVSLPDIIRLLIRDFRATPRRHDWQSILSA